MGFVALGVLGRAGNRDMALFKDALARCCGMEGCRCHRARTTATTTAAVAAAATSRKSLEMSIPYHSSLQGTSMLLALR